MIYRRGASQLDFERTTGAVAQTASRIAGYWRAARSNIIVGAAVLLPLATFMSAYFWIKTRGTNEAIAQLSVGRDRPVDADEATPELVAARIVFLAKRDEIDEARTLVEAIEAKGPAELAATARYNLGNAVLRRAFSTIEKGDIERSTPLVVLARREYRRALQLSPNLWDTKFNLDVASRLIRDFKEYERKEGDELQADPKKLWTDIPGAPKGLP